MLYSRFKHNIENHDITFKYHDLDFEDGGIYDYKGKKKMEDYVLNGHNVRVMVNQLRDQVGQNLGRGPISPYELFPPDRVNIDDWRDRVLGVFAPVFTFLDYFGRSAAILTALVIIYHYASRAFVFVMGARAIHELVGFSWQLCTIFCTDHFLLTREKLRAMEENRVRRPRTSTLQKTIKRLQREERWRRKRDNKVELKVSKKAKNLRTADTTPLAEVLRLWKTKQLTISGQQEITDQQPKAMTRPPRPPMPNPPEQQQTAPNQQPAAQITSGKPEMTRIGKYHPSPPRPRTEFTAHTSLPSTSYQSPGTPVSVPLYSWVNERLSDPNHLASATITDDIEMQYEPMGVPGVTQSEKGEI